MFADEAVIYASYENLDNLINIMQEVLNIVSKWCTFNKLCLNAKKTNILCLSKSFHRHLNFENIPKLKLLVHEIKYVETCDYLGIRLDRKLSMIPYMNKVKSQVMHKIYMLSRVRKYLKLEASITIFKSMLLTYFEYGSIFLEPCPEKLKSKPD